VSDLTDIGQRVMRDFISRKNFLSTGIRGLNFHFSSAISFANFASFARHFNSRQKFHTTSAKTVHEFLLNVNFASCQYLFSTADFPGRE